MRLEGRGVVLGKLRDGLGDLLSLIVYFLIMGVLNVEGLVALEVRLLVYLYW